MAGTTNQTADENNFDNAYWQEMLHGYLEKSNKGFYHSLASKGELEKFLNARAQAAFHEYYTNKDSGLSEHGSMELSLLVLFKGIDFSRELFLEELLQVHFPSYYDFFLKNQVLDKWVEQLEQACSAIFSKTLLEPEKSIEHYENELLPTIFACLIQTRIKI